MKAQISLELMVALLAFTAAIFIVVSASNSNNSLLKEKISLLSSWISKQETTTYCNFVYLKGEISDYEVRSTKISAEAECFSDEYYLNQNMPKVGAMRPWF